MKDTVMSVWAVDGMQKMKDAEYLGCFFLCVWKATLWGDCDHFGENFYLSCLQGIWEARNATWVL